MASVRLGWAQLSIRAAAVPPWISDALSCAWGVHGGWLWALLWAWRAPARCCSSPSRAAPCPIPLQVRLEPLIPQTEEEKIEYSIAAERRRMRLVHKDTLKDLLTSSPQETGTVPCLLPK